MALDSLAHDSKAVVINAPTKSLPFNRNPIVGVTIGAITSARNTGGFIFDRLFQPLLLRNAYKDKERQEAAIRASSLDWVIVRPGALNDEPARGNIRAFTDVAGIHGGKIARADVARFVVDQLATDTWLIRTPLILW